MAISAHFQPCVPTLTYDVQEFIRNIPYVDGVDPRGGLRLFYLGSLEPIIRRVPILFQYPCFIVKRVHYGIRYYKLHPSVLFVSDLCLFPEE